MKLICIEEDHPGYKDILKKCRGLSDVSEASGFSNGKEALDWFLSQDSAMAIVDVDLDMPRIRVKTFGNFEIFVDGDTVAFKRQRAKEVLAYLVDRQGSGVSRAEIFAALYEDEEYDRSYQKQLDVIIRSLKETLNENGISRFLDTKGGLLRIIPEMADCDLYRFFKGDEEAKKEYRGEYMSSYSWGMMTEAYIDQSMILGR
ncbi:MAG: winged helix-turn-helix domain-containing protein [Lachnospiraceae bacterium]|nr:winged helix-turn-helix domain-containing protein [Lachnospiraceae bacterium]